MAEQNNHAQMMTGSTWKKLLLPFKAIVFLPVQVIGFVYFTCLFFLLVSGLASIFTMLADHLERLEHHGVKKWVRKSLGDNRDRVNAVFNGSFKQVLLELFVMALALTPIPFFVRRHFRRQGYQIVPVFVDRIGHIAAELDGIVKEWHLSVEPQPRAMVLAPRNRKTSNQDMIRHYSKYVRVIESPLLCNIISSWTPTEKIPFCNDRLGGFPVQRVHDILFPHDRAAKYPHVLARYGDRPSVIGFSDQDREQGARLLAQLGVPANAWYVCVHCREPGFHKGESISNCRDASIENYLLALSTIVERGGWCIRMGDPTMTKLPAMPGVIDYAHHELRSGWLDVYLSGTCRFFLGSPSGLAQVATAFGVPCATANQVPLSVVYNHGIHDISIPKLYWSKTDNQRIPFETILDAPMGNFRFTHSYDKANVSVIENTPEEIRDLVLEMLEYLENQLVYSEQDEKLQDQVRSYFREQHYCYYSKGRIGRSFLRKYQDLIQSNSAIKSVAA